MEDGLAIALMFLAYTCIILFTVITVFVIMLIRNLMELSKSYTKLSDTIQREIQPTLEEIKKALEGINGLATGVDKQLTAFKNSFTFGIINSINLYTKNINDGKANIPKKAFEKYTSNSILVNLYRQ